MRATLADIARETGLTLGTVSRALSAEGKYAIAPKTRDRVAEAASRLGYRPNMMGRALAAGSASLVLLLSPDPFAPYYVEISRRLSAQAARNGYTFLSGSVLLPGEDGVPPNGWLYGVDGIVVCDDYHPHQAAYIAEALRLHIPIVGLGIRHPFPSDFVKVDLYSAARSLMAHFAQRGGCRLGMVCAPGILPDDPRLTAYTEACEENGLPVRRLGAVDQSRASGRQAILDHFVAGGPFDGIFCENDVLAVGAYRGLTDLGVRVPEDLLLAGCDGLDDALFQRTPITTLVQPLDRMCERAWTMLQERIKGSTEPARTEVVSATLETRASTLRA